jgi:hypothetical protein
MYRIIAAAVLHLVAQSNVSVWLAYISTDAVAFDAGIDDGLRIK